MIVADLFARLGIKTDRGSVKHAESAIDKLGHRLNHLLEIAGAVHLFHKTVGATAELGAQLAKTSEQLGISTRDLQELQYAAELSEVSTGSLEAGLRYLARTAKKRGDYRPLTEQLLDVADKVNATENDTKKLSIATQGLGRSAGPELVLFLKKGRGGIEELRKEAEELGGVMGEDGVNAGREYEDSMKKLGFVVRGIRNTIFIPLVKTVVDLLKGFTEWFKQHREGVIYIANVALKVLAFVAGLRLLKVVLGGVVSFFKEWRRVLSAGIFGFIFLLIEDFVGFLQGKESVIGHLVKAFQQGLLENNAGDPWWLKAFKTALRIVREITDSWRMYIGGESAEAIEHERRLRRLTEFIADEEGVSFEKAEEMAKARLARVEEVEKVEKKAAIFEAGKTIGAGGGQEFGEFIRGKGFGPAQLQFLADVANQNKGVIPLSGSKIAVPQAQAPLAGQLGLQVVIQGAPSADFVSKIRTAMTAAAQSVVQQHYDQSAAAVSQ